MKPLNMNLKHLNIYLTLYYIVESEEINYAEYAECLVNCCLVLHPFIASEESILLSHMGPPKSAIKSLILVVEQFCMKHFFILFQF